MNTMADLVQESVSKHFAAALVSLNEGLANASKEISAIHKNVVSKQTRHEKLTAELAHVKTELEGKRLKVVESNAREQVLQKELADCTKQLGIMKYQSGVDEKRVTKLEQQVIEVGNWKDRAAIAEQQRAKLQLQLSTLRTALLHLTMDPAVVDTKQKTTAGADSATSNVSAKPSTDVTTDSTTTTPSSEQPKPELEPEQPKPEPEAEPEGVQLPELEPESEEEEAVALPPLVEVGQLPPLQPGEEEVAPLPPLELPLELEPVVPSTPIDSRFKTQLCLFHQRGDCKRGSKCLYAHGQHELRLNPGKYHKNVSAVAAMGFDVDVAVIGALFQEYKGDTERVLAKLLLNN